MKRERKTGLRMRILVERIPTKPQKEVRSSVGGFESRGRKGNVFAWTEALPGLAGG